MKKLLLIVLLTLGGLQFCKAQTLYILTRTTALEQVDADGNPIGGSNPVARSGWKFEVDYMDVAGDYIISFCKWTKGSRKDYNNDNFYEDPGTGNPILFKISAENWATYAQELTEEERQGSIQPKIGATTLPLKIRPGSRARAFLENGETRPARYFDFSAEANLGLTGGVHIDRGKWGSGFLGIGVNASSVRVDSVNTRGYAEASTKVSAVSTFLTFMYEPNSEQRFQVGIAIGMDFIPGELGQNWDYHGKPWIGIGIGFSLFTPSETKKPDSKNRSSP